MYFKISLDLLQFRLQLVAFRPLLLEVDVAAVVEVGRLWNWESRLRRPLLAVELQDEEANHVLKKQQPRYKAFVYEGHKVTLSLKKKVKGGKCWQWVSVTKTTPVCREVMVSRENSLFRGPGFDLSFL